MQLVSAMTRDRFLELTGDVGWATVDQIKERLDAGGFWSDDFEADAVEARKKAWIRQNARAVKGDDGRPIFASVVTVDPETGEERRAYKQESLFDADDYRQLAGYHLDLAWHHFSEARHYAETGRERWGVQIPLSLPDPNGNGH